jgi:membrane protease YdiL (CAAX protease family)
MILVPATVFAKLRYGKVSVALPFSIPGARQTIFSVLAVFALQQVLQVYMAIQDSIPLPTEIQNIVDLVKKLYEEAYQSLLIARSPWEFVAVVFAVALVPALSEEVLFRGIVQHSLAEQGGGLRAAIATGIIFGAYHMNPISLVPLVVLGAFFGYLVYRCGNLTVAVSAHFFNNFVACVASYLGVADDAVLISPGGSVNGPVLLLNASVFLFIFVGATYLFNHATDGAVEG